MAFISSVKNVGVYTDEQQKIKDQMAANSALWHTADAATKLELQKKNQNLANQLGGLSFDSTTGMWSGDAVKNGVLSNVPTYTGSSNPVSTGSGKPTYDYSTIQASRPTFDSGYADRIDAMLNQVLNREEFSYDAESDPLYQQYKAQYQREGNRAMNDTLAAAASNAGGMNSYAMTAAQQANDYYNAQLNDKIPELYQLAYEMYLDDRSIDVENLGLLQDMYETEYGMYRDSMNDWYADRDFGYGMYRDEMGDYQWDTEFDESVRQWQESFDYGKERDKVADSQWQKEFDAANSQWQQEFNAANSQWEKEYALAAAKQAASGSSGSSGSSGGSSSSSSSSSSDSERKGKTASYDNGSLTTAQVKALQKALGVTQDGYYGPATKKAAGGRSAGAAYAYYVGSNQAQEKAATTEANADKTEAAYSGMELGIGPTTASFLQKLLSYGAISEVNGKFKWNSGWSASNYRQKMASPENSWKGFYNTTLMNAFK